MTDGLGLTDRPLLLEGGSQTLADLVEDEVWGALRRHGAILFRGFNVDADGFHAYAARFNRSFLMSPFSDRKTVENNTDLQTVTVGKAGLTLHFEYGASPMRPDLLWFYCCQPAAAGRGGETLLADGAAIVERLHSATRDALTARRVSYHSFLPVTAFDALIRHNRVTSALGTEDRLSLLDQHGSFAVLEENERFVRSLYTTCAVRTRASDGHAVLCQDILTDAYKKASPDDRTESFSTVLTWEDGAPIEEAIIADVRAVTRTLTRGVRWRAGDFALIDNNRMLHGRNQTTDPDRKLVMLSSYSTRFGLGSASTAGLA